VYKNHDASVLDSVYFCQSVLKVLTIFHHEAADSPFYVHRLCSQCYGSKKWYSTYISLVILN